MSVQQRSSTPDAGHIWTPCTKDLQKIPSANWYTGLSKMLGVQVLRKSNLWPLQIQKYLSDSVQFAGFHCRSTPGLNNKLCPSSVRSLRFSSDNSWHLLLSSFLSVSWSFYRPSDKLLGTKHSRLLSPFERLNLMFILSVLMINPWSAAGFTKLEILIFDLKLCVFLTSPLRREVD